jgi:putative tryptophan/tyrosine transport system substrate-binding protein
MRAYRPLRRVGLIYNTDELNARLKAEELRALAVEEGLELVELRIEPGADGKPSPEAIAPKVEEAAGEGVDFLYVASSSFLMAERDRLTAAALAAGLPLASAYEAMVVESQALLAVAARYYNVGRLAGFQAEQILLHGADPATMPIRGLDRFSYLVNMETARRLGLYPPLDVLRYAEIINGIPADPPPAAAVPPAAP